VSWGHEKLQRCQNHQLHHFLEEWTGILCHFTPLQTWVYVSHERIWQYTPYISLSTHDMCFQCMGGDATYPLCKGRVQPKIKMVTFCFLLHILKKIIWVWNVMWVRKWQKLHLWVNMLNVMSRSKLTISWQPKQLLAHNYHWQKALKLIFCHKWCTWIYTLPSQ